jgi:hypothetical protein
VFCLLAYFFNVLTLLFLQYFVKLYFSLNNFGCKDTNKKGKTSTFAKNFARTGGTSAIQTTYRKPQNIEEVRVTGLLYIVLGDKKSRK